jgi:hypothetical protein
MADGSFEHRDAAALLRKVPMSLWPEPARRRRTMLQLAAERAERLLADLVEKLEFLEPDVDLEDDGDAEDQCEDEGAQCDDEGHDSDREAVNEDGDSYSDGPVPNYTSHHDQRTPAGGIFTVARGVY